MARKTRDISKQQATTSLKGVSGALDRRLFWDVRPEDIDDEKHRRFVIRRVLERGSLVDLRRMVARYSMATVLEEVRQMRSLDPVTRAFAACLCGVREETLECSTSMP